MSNLDEIHTLAHRVLTLCQERELRLVSAESCTGGLLTAFLTEIAGASATVEGGFIVYSNRAKADLLGIPWETIKSHGAVSATVARLMAQQAVTKTSAHVGLAITGIAGPKGAHNAKPVGRVHIAVAKKNGATFVTTHAQCDFGDQGRQTVRLLSVKSCLELLMRAMEAT